MKKQIRYSIEKLTSAGHGQNINFLFKSFLTARDALDNENKGIRYMKLIKNSHCRMLNMFQLCDN